MKRIDTRVGEGQGSSQVLEIVSSGSCNLRTGPDSGTAYNLLRFTEETKTWFTCYGVDTWRWHFALTLYTTGLWQGKVIMDIKICLKIAQVQRKLETWLTEKKNCFSRQVNCLLNVVISL